MIDQNKMSFYFPPQFQCCFLVIDFYKMYLLWPIKLRLYRGPVQTSVELDSTIPKRHSTQFFKYGQNLPPWAIWYYSSHRTSQTDCGKLKLKLEFKTWCLNFRRTKQSQFHRYIHFDYIKKLFLIEWRAIIPKIKILYGRKHSESGDQLLFKLINYLWHQVLRLKLIPRNVKRYWKQFLELKNKS